MTCCDRPMEPVDFPTNGVREPSLDGLLRMVFGMSPAELDVCLCVMEGGEQTAAGLAERVDYDRSVVSRHLNHLAELGIVEKRRRLLEQGGQVFVYLPTDPAVVRRRLLEAFVGWVAQASGHIEALSREKVEAIVESDAPASQWRIYQK